MKERFENEIKDLAAGIRAIYLSGGNESLPAGLRAIEPDFDFIELATFLWAGDCGAAVYLYGRKFIELLLSAIVDAELYEFLPLVYRAIEAGESWSDNIGHLPAGSPETTSSDSSHIGVPLSEDWMERI
ncbi:hypothetical protein GCM10027594_01400 [Hymenobacter agri]